MIRVECPGCRKRYRFDESKLGGRATATAKCPSCGGALTLQAEAGGGEGAGTATQTDADAGGPPPAATLDKTRKLDLAQMKLEGSGMQKMGVTRMPEGKRISLAVMSGQDDGKIFQCDKGKMTIGRTGTDIVINDMKASRAHAQLEFYGNKVILRDLGSTNGTFSQGAQVTEIELSNHDEFSIGSTTMMLIVTAEE